MLTVLFLLFCAYLCKDRIDWAVLLVCGVFLLACSSSDGKNIDAARCLDGGTLDHAGAVDVRVGADLAPDSSPNRLPEATASDCLPLDTGSPDLAEAGKADLGQAQDVPAVDASKTIDQASGEVSRGIDAEEVALDTGGPCAARQILVNGTCQPCGGVGLKCCLTGDKCSAQGLCLNDACFRCSDIGGPCCEGNTCTGGSCKAGLCVNA